MLLIWVPVALYFLISAIRQPATWRLLAIHPGRLCRRRCSSGRSPSTLLHRFVFHYQPRTPRQERIFFLVPRRAPRSAAVQDAPGDAACRQRAAGLRLLRPVLPRRGRVLLGAAALDRPDVLPVYLTGYLAYDMTHYATHHFPMRHGYLEVPQALSHAAPLQDARSRASASARRSGTRSLAPIQLAPRPPGVSIGRRPGLPIRQKLTEQL